MTARIVPLLGMALLTAPQALLAAEEGEPGLFSMNYGLALWTIVVFVAALWILGRYAWKPILSAVEAREKGIQDSLDQASRLREEAERSMQEHRSQLADARRQSQQILADARDAAERMRREMEDKARSEGEALLERARREIGRERDAALEQLRAESVELALAAASRLIAAKVDPATDRALVEAFVTELGAGGGAAGVR